MTHQAFAGILCLLLWTAAPVRGQSPDAATLPHVIANDNKAPAGQLKDGVLTLRLELRRGRWCPESEEGIHLNAYTFAEVGGPPQNPGPFIRVPQGTTIRASVHNRLPLAATVHGLHRHPGDDADVLTLAAGETRDVEFTAGDPGTYLYWATTSGKTIGERKDEDTLLSGAFVVDEPGPSRGDRTFVLEMWTRGTGRDFEEVPIINGKSWPFTERLTYRTGETARWRVLDASESDHAMHLHGFYFSVIGVGDGERFERYREDERRKVVTEFMEPGHVFEMTWTPERSGNWVFHCHMVAHMSPSETLHPKTPGTPAADHPGHGADPSAGMGGLVVGITVTPGEVATAPAPAGTPRALQLVLSDNPAKVPLYSLVLNDPAVAKPADGSAPKPGLMGPPIVLTRGQPAAIEVRNETTGPTAIHWHGIELESYYDGVPGLTGTGQQITPPIEPGQAFVARMTPPRAGTFMYHTHWHDNRQLLNGVYGPLIVIEPGETYDPERDKTFLVSLSNYPPFGPMLLVNGTPEPFPLFLTSGTTYRFRFINITDNVSGLRWHMTSDDAPVEWKVIAKDGAALPPAQVKSAKADLAIAVGETWDVEYQATRPGRVDLQVWLPSFPVRLTQPLVFAPPK